MGMNNSIAERALEMLGRNLAPVIVANALGVTESAISQLMANEEFAAAVMELRVAALDKHAKLDQLYEDIELTMAKKLKDTCELVFEPAKVVGMLTRINAMKRRSEVQGSGGLVAPSVVVSLVMPTRVVNEYTLSAGNNQVVSVSSSTPLLDSAPSREVTSLVTMQKGSLGTVMAKRFADREEKVKASEAAVEAKFGPSEAPNSLLASVTASLPPRTNTGVPQEA